MNNSTRRLLETTILTTAELSERTGIPEATLQKWAQRGTVQAVKKGRTLLFDVRDFPDVSQQTEPYNSDKTANLDKTAP